MAGFYTGFPSLPRSRSGSRQQNEHDKRLLDSYRCYGQDYRRHFCGRQEQCGRISLSQQHRHQSLWQQQNPPISPDGSTQLLLSSNIEGSQTFSMERTPSGNSIITGGAYESRHNHLLNMKGCSDEKAARDVEYHSKSRSDNNNFVRYFRKIIEGDNQLSDRDLDMILVGADTVFFHKTLSGRVMWEWSHPTQARYETELIGSTALRRSTSQDGFETLIILSAPILRFSGFDRRLLLSAFLHELVHCYLFIRCGFTAREQGGHTEGFHTIAGRIDEWMTGCGVHLRLCNMKARLEHFRVEQRSPVNEGSYWHSHEGCSQSLRNRWKADEIDDGGWDSEWS